MNHFDKRQVGIVEERSRGDGEPVATVVAVKLIARRYARDAVRIAARTLDAFRPAKLFEVLAATVVASEAISQLHEAHVLGVHGAP